MSSSMVRFSLYLLAPKGQFIQPSISLGSLNETQGSFIETMFLFSSMTINSPAEAVMATGGLS
jgi:hypothetical protein